MGFVRRPKENLSFIYILCLVETESSYSQFEINILHCKKVSNEEDFKIDIWKMTFRKTKLVFLEFVSS